MKATRFFAMLTLLLLVMYLPTQAFRESLPAPAVSPNQLFYLQRSKDANVVIYEANVTTGKTLDPAKPIQVYWMRYAEQGQREELSPIQWRMAFGYSHKPSSSDADAYDIRLNAFGKRPLHITNQHGKPVATIRINGQWACLRNIFVQVDPRAHLIPHVQYIDLYGSSIETGQPVYERIVPN